MHADLVGNLLLGVSGECNWYSFRRLSASFLLIHGLRVMFILRFV
jgi:hypothetical protein